MSACDCRPSFFEHACTMLSSHPVKRKRVADASKARAATTSIRARLPSSSRTLRREKKSPLLVRKMVSRNASLKKEKLRRDKGRASALRTGRTTSASKKQRKVKELRGKKMAADGAVWYLAHWEGCDSDEDSWEQAAGLGSDEWLVSEWEAEQVALRKPAISVRAA